MSELEPVADMTRRRLKWCWIIVIGFNLALWGIGAVLNPEMLFSYIENWKGDPVLYSMPVLAYTLFQVFFGLFASFIICVEETVERADRACRGIFDDD